MSFERHILRNVLKLDIPIERFRCTMTQARSMALPGKLELCAKALALPQQKDMGGHKIMLKWCAPLKDGTWADDPKEYQRLYDYCGDDVLTEIGIGEMLRPMTDEEWEDYFITERINDRGIPLDLQLAAAAQKYAGDELAEIKIQLGLLTHGEVTTPKQYQKIKVWAAKYLPPEFFAPGGLLEPDADGKPASFDAAVREMLLAPDNDDLITGEVREVIQLIHDGGRASTAKFAAMQARSNEDWRARGCYIMNGAGQTQRFSSSGVQVHNLIRDKLENIEFVVEAILEGVPKKRLLDIASYRDDGTFVFDKGEQMTKPYNILTVLSRTLRPSIVAENDKTLVWGDWKSIEAVTLPWLSKENSASEILDYHASGKDMYVRQAALTYGVKEDAVTKIQRQNGGKIPILSFGFGGGAGAIMAMARAYGVTMDEKMAEMLKNAWRETNPWARRFWDALEIAAFCAVEHPEQVFHAGRVSYFMSQSVLWCLLPSGNLLAYPFPRIERSEGRWGPQIGVTAIKGSFHPKKDSNYWPRMKLWGGIQAENVTQATATGCGVLRWTLRQLDRAGWPLIGHTHDEPLMEVYTDEVNDAKAALKHTMTTGPSWAAGLPLLADIEAGAVYGK